jgi:hypothetical protein
MGCRMVSLGFRGIGNRCQWVILQQSTLSVQFNSIRITYNQGSSEGQGALRRVSQGLLVICSNDSTIQRAGIQFQGYTHEYLRPHQTQCFLIRLVRFVSVTPEATDQTTKILVWRHLWTEPGSFYGQLAERDFILNSIAKVQLVTWSSPWRDHNY